MKKYKRYQYYEKCDYANNEIERELEKKWFYVCGRSFIKDKGFKDQNEERKQNQRLQF